MNNRVEIDIKDDIKSPDDIKKLSCSYFSDLSSKDDIAQSVKEKMNKLFSELDRLKMTDLDSLKGAISGINEALISKDEKELYALYDSYDEIKKAIANKQERIKQRLKLSFESAEELIYNTNLDNKDEILGLLNNAVMRETRLFEILKEAAQIALISAVEDAHDVAETSKEIIKNMTYNAIMQGEFNKERILFISKSLILSTAEVANEGKLFARELIDGAVFGTKDGILKFLQKMKDDIKFAPDELKLAYELNELRNIDEDFIELLRQLEKELEFVAKDEIKRLLDTTLDSNFARLKRMSDQTSEQILMRIEELKTSEHLNEIIANATQKIESLKSELSGLKLNMDISNKIESIKNELNELKNSKKIDELKNIDLKDEAKKFGERAYKAAKDFALSIKKNKE